MSLSPRALLGAAPAVIVLAGSFLLSRQYLAEAERAEARDTVVTQGETVMGLSAEDEDRLHRVALKTETVTDLLAGQLSLAEAVDRFEMLLRATPEGPGPGPSLPEPSGPERAVEQILAFARVRAHHHPERFAEAVARLESEAAAFLAQVRTAH